jgi:hypothetical protein
MSGRVWIDEDNAHFYDQHPPEDMTVAGLQRLVDGYCEGTNVGGVVFCANVQRALFDSRVWEPLWHGYDPEAAAGAEHQPQFANLPEPARGLVPDTRGRYWVHNLWLLKQRGIDHLAVWLERTRHHGRSAWLSMRMNDCHLNHDPAAFWHSSLWKDRPDLRRCPQPRDGDWFEGAFDYEQPEVREHHVSLIAELCERYEMDGLLLDWVRWVRHLRPGRERAGAGALTAVMRRARELTRRAGERRGRPMELGVRLPTDPQACLDLGYDVITWGRERLVDRVVLAPFLEQAAFDWPVRMWRSLLGEHVAVVCQTDASMRPFPEHGPGGLVRDYQLLAGSAASAYEDGADGVYLFNECYRESPGDEAAAADPGLLDVLWKTVGDPDAVREAPRRQAVSYHQIVGPGRGTAAALPVPLSKPAGHWEFARHGKTISLAIPLGGQPCGPGMRVSLVLGLDAASPPSPAGWRVWLNGHRLDGEAAVSHGEPDHPVPQVAHHLFSWPVAREGLEPQDNVLELLVPDGTAGRVVWVELRVGRPMS